MFTNGYVRDMLNKNMNLKEFVLHYSRAFGYLSHMREDLPDSPIREVTVIEYYFECVAKSKQKLFELQNMSNDQKLEFSRSEINKLLKMWNTEKEKEELERIKIQRMISDLEKWIPPTKNHEGLKNHALESLRSAEASDYYDEEIKKLNNYDLIKYYEKELEGAVNRLKRDEDSLKDQKEYCKKANSWIKQLKDSLC